MMPQENTPPHHLSESPLIARRRVLGAFGMTGLGLLASSSIASAFQTFAEDSAPHVSVPVSPGRSSSGNPLADLPEEWVQTNGTLAAPYLHFLDTLKLQNISPKQVLASHAKARGRVWNTLPPKQWWDRIGYVLKVVDRIAREMNVSQVEVISAYRCPPYNARCPGAKSGSWHQANVAADVKFHNIRPSKVTATARHLRNLGLFHGGVGGYWNFTHIDGRGFNVDW